MANREQTLAMVAQVVDKFSGPIRDMQRALNQLGDKQTKTNREGARAVIAHQKAMKELHKNFKEAGDAIKQVFNPAIGEMGFSLMRVAGPIATVGAALAAMSKGAVDLGGISRHFDILNQKTGMSVASLRAWEEVSKRIGSSPEAMDTGLTAFASQLDQLRKNRGDLWNTLRVAPGFGGLLDQLKNSKSNDEAIQYALQAVQNRKIPEPEREMLLGSLHLDPNMALKQTQDEYNQVMKFQGSLSKDTIAKAERMQDAFDNVAVALNRLKMDLGTLALPAVESFAKNLEHFAAWFEKWESKADSLFGAIGKLFGGNGQSGNEYQGKNAHNAPPDYSKQQQGLRDWWDKNAAPSSGKYQGKNPLFHQSAYITGDDGSGGYTGSGGELYRTIFSGTMQGVLEAFKSWLSGSQTGAGGGFTRASYEGGDSGGSGGHGGRSGGDGGLGPDPSAGKPYALPKGKAGTRANAIMQRLMSKWGWTKAGAAIAAANADSESSFNPNALGDHGISHGMWQWNKSRFAALQKYAASIGKNWRDWQAQTDFFAQEATKRVPGMAHAHDLSRAGALSFAFEGYRNRAEDWERARKAHGYLRHYDDPGISQASKTAQPAHGKADLNIKFHNAPKHSSHLTVAGNLFQDIELDRGKTAPALS